VGDPDIILADEPHRGTCYKNRGGGGCASLKSLIKKGGSSHYSLLTMSILHLTQKKPYRMNDGELLNETCKT